MAPSGGSEGDWLLLEALRETGSHASACFWGPLAVLGLWLHQSSLCLWLHITFSMCLPPFPSPIRIFVVGFRAHPDNPESSRLEALSLNHICKDTFSNVVIFTGGHYTSIHTGIRFGVPPLTHHIIYHIIFFHLSSRMLME